MTKLRFLLLGASLSGIYAQAESDLARVGIAEFRNLGRHADYDWVEKSLPDAIDTSMKARFEFVRQDENKVNAAVAQVTGEAQQSRIDTAAKIATLSQSDILIFGEFTVDTEKSELTLKARIYNAAGRRFIGEIEEKSEINSRVFKSIDQMAAQIVSHIYQYALQANKGSSYGNLKLLVLVSSFGNDTERAQADTELQKMKTELARQSPGTYLTLYEFFDKYHIVAEEQHQAITLAQTRNAPRMKLWLERFGVTDALVVFVRDNKVNITAIGTEKTAQVSYAIGAGDAEKKKALEQAQMEIGPKQTLKKAGGADERFLLHFGAIAGKGTLTSGDKIGALTGISAHLSWRPWRFFQPQLRFDGYYGFKGSQATDLLGGSALGGLGYTFGSARWAVTPYLLWGIFTAQIKKTDDQIRVLLPSAGGGFTAAYFFRERFGMSFNMGAQYVVDADAPALFLIGSLSTVVRF